MIICMRLIYIIWQEITNSDNNTDSSYTGNKKSDILYVIIITIGGFMSRRRSGYEEAKEAIFGDREINQTKEGEERNG